MPSAPLHKMAWVGLAALSIPSAARLVQPLELRDRSALAILACIITATPGSAWLEYDAARGTVLIHVLDLIDEQQWIDTIKHRYERLLLEIFQ